MPLMDKASSLHILLWSPAWPLAEHQNGIVTYVHWIRTALETLSHRVTILTGHGSVSESDASVYLARPRLWASAARLLTARRRPLEDEIFGFSRLIASEILRVHRRDPIDVIEMEESFGWHAEVSRRTGIPVVVRLHGPAFLSLVEEEIQTEFGQRRIEREGLALRRAEMIVSPSRTTLMQTIERHQITNPEVHHIVNPLDLQASNNLWRLSDSDPNRILFVGRFDLRKGADVILRAFRSALQRNPSLRLMFVGPDSGIPSKEHTVHLKEYVQQLFPSDLQDRVEYLGRRSNEEVMKLRLQCRTTVVASRWENQGYAVLEAMLQGCPVVCTDAGGCPENVMHERNGRLARSGDADSFATEMLAMVANPTEAERMGVAARRYVIERHAPNDVATASVALYHRLLSHQGDGEPLRQYVN